MWEKKGKLINIFIKKSCILILILILPLFAWLLYYYPSYKNVKTLKAENQRLEGEIYQYNQSLNINGNIKEELENLEKNLEELESYTYCGSQLDEVFSMMEEALIFSNFQHQQVELGGIVFSQDSSFGFMILNISFEGAQDDLMIYIKNIEDNYPGLIVEDLRFYQAPSFIYGSLRVMGTLRF